MSQSDKPDLNVTFPLSPNELVLIEPHHGHGPPPEAAPASTTHEVGESGDMKPNSYSECKLRHPLSPPEKQRTSHRSIVSKSLAAQYDEDLFSWPVALLKSTPKCIPKEPQLFQSIYDL